MIKRYYLSVEVVSSVKEQDNGEYVKYSDHLSEMKAQRGGFIRALSRIHESVFAKTGYRPNKEVAAEITKLEKE